MVAAISHAMCMHVRVVRVQAVRTARCTAVRRNDLPFMFPPSPAPPTHGRNPSGYQNALTWRHKLTHVAPVWYQLRASKGADGKGPM